MSLRRRKFQAKSSYWREYEMITANSLHRPDGNGHACALMRLISFLTVTTVFSCTGQSTGPQVQSGGVYSVGGAAPMQSGGTNSTGSGLSGGGTSVASAASCPTGMVLIGAGDFIMGSEPGEPLVRDNEMPRHLVTLRDYCLDTYEVTNAQYQACVAAGRCTVPRAVEPPSGYGEASRSKRPVVGLSWEQASTYCEWANKRLPTEAEWEKGARGPAPDARLYPWGETTSPSPTTIYYCPQDSDVDLPTFDVSPYGIRNMVSGAPEWVADWYDATYYSTSPVEDPRGPQGGTQHVVRSSPCAACAATLSPKRVAYRQTCTERSIDAVGVRCAGNPAR